MASLLTIPEIQLNSSSKMPVLGLGTASFSSSLDEEKGAVLDAIERGYRHIDTASLYGSEEAVGEAIAEALRRGLIQSREQLFITSKLWCSDAHADRVLPALQKTLKNLKVEYLDLYLIHWPVSVKPGNYEYPIKDKKNVVLFDCKAVWAAMEDCQRLGLVKSIGVSNFSCKKIEDMLAFTRIPPAVNQVELNPCWQQKKLIEFCKSKGIVVTSFSPLGAVGTSWGSNRVMENKVLNQIANEKGKSVPQVCLRWAYQQGVSIVVKSYKAERMEENRDIFGWELSDEECKKIGEIPQRRNHTGEEFVSEDGPIKSLEDLWDGEI